MHDTSPIGFGDYNVTLTLNFMVIMTTITLNADDFWSKYPNLYPTTDYLVELAQEVVGQELGISFKEIKLLDTTIEKLSV